MQNVLDRLTRAALDRRQPNREDALALLQSADHEIPRVVAGAYEVRHAFFGNRVKLNFLLNMKSGLCPEDCHYCSQRRDSTADILKYPMLGTSEAVEAAERAVRAGAKRLCMVASGRGPVPHELEQVATNVRAVKQAYPHLEICACLGLLTEAQAEELKDAGVYAYNHNLNTSEKHYDQVCGTHTYQDRVETVGRAAQAGLSPCSGVLCGMGESDEDIVDVASDLRGLEPDSVPINFLIPIDGTPLAGRWELTPQRCLRILAAFRFYFPDVEVRIAGGREVHLRSLQPLGLLIANSIFTGDYLTTEGQPASADRQMITDLGFVIEGMEEATLPRERAVRDAGDVSYRNYGAGHPADESEAAVRIRRRGAGTELPANN